MDIVGLDEVTLTTDDLALGDRYLTDYGLTRVESGSTGGLYHAKNGGGIRMRHTDGVGMAAPVAAGPNIREAMWGVTDKAALERIGAELSKDRQVQMGDDGVLRSTDDDGYALAFRVTQTHAFDGGSHGANVPGMPPGRPVNSVADYYSPVQSAEFSHLVFYTNDLKRAVKFYQERLGFFTTDKFTGRGEFLRADGNHDHHNLFMVEREGPVGLHHVAFHVRDQLQMMLAGKAMEQKGWETAWGPGRHIFGGNNFWYFKSPFGGNMEIDADMDMCDANWVPREVEQSADTAAIFMMQHMMKRH